MNAECDWHKSDEKCQKKGWMVPAKGRLQKENNNGPRIEPCGTSQVREAVLEENLLTLTEKVPSDKQEENQSNTEPEISAKTSSLLSNMVNGVKDCTQIK